jgi:hypothetical protein
MISQALDLCLLKESLYLKKIQLRLQLQEVLAIQKNYPTLIWAL